MTEHTPEPWRTRGSGTIIYDKDGWCIASATVYHRIQEDGEAEANARRIVACVNACAGVPNHILAAGNSISAARYANELAAQRDELLAAIKYLLEDTQHKTHICEDEKYCPVQNARSAIAKAEK